MKCKRCGGNGLEPDHSIIGTQLRTLREHRQVSLRNLATAMKISAPYLSDLEQGRRAWNAERITLFKKCLAELAKRA